VKRIHREDRRGDHSQEGAIEAQREEGECSVREDNAKEGRLKEEERESESQEGGAKEGWCSSRVEAECARGAPW